MATRRVKPNNLSSDADDAPPMLSLITQILLTPLHVASSPVAIRSYTRAALLLLTATALYLVAVVAYIIFYNAYVPDVNLVVPLHLQYDHLVHDTRLDPKLYSPYAVANILSPSDPTRGRSRSSGWLGSGLEVSAKRGTPAAKPGRMISGLEYDIDVILIMPRTPTNLAAGNFMLELSMLSASSPPASTSTSDTQFFGSGSGYASAPTSPRSETNGMVLAHSSRPATLTYTSPFLGYATQLFTMPLYMLSFRSESETLRIPMFERVAFSGRSSSASAVPEQLRLEIKSRERLQVYSVTVEVQARFAGMRWIMSRHRVLSFLIFPALFWLGEMVFTLVVWAATSLLFSSTVTSTLFPAESKTSFDAGLATSSEEERRGRISTPAAASLKREDDADDVNLSDTERTFPTYSRQPPLRYTSPPQVKREEDDDDDEAGDRRVASRILPVTTTAGEADDEEDEDADFVMGEPGSAVAGGPYGEFHDSGIGTSLESSAGLSTRRRKSNK